MIFREVSLFMQNSAFSAGCSAMSWQSENGLHFWGRNFDFNRIDGGSAVLYLPRGEDICAYLPADGQGRRSVSAKYACLGTGTLSVPSAPVLYDGVNEKGLAGGQLYFREYARYLGEACRGALPVQPGLALVAVLSQCATVEEAVRAFREKIALVPEPLYGAVPPLHWCFADRSGECAVIEPQGAVHIYRNSLGVMTNSPDYLWHKQNLLNYPHLRPLDHGAFRVGDTHFAQCFSGSGMFGLPGDWSSPSRFIRLAMLKQHCLKGRTEEQAVAYMFRAFASVAFPLGMVEVSHFGDVTEYDKNVLPFDYTVYTAIACCESLRYYWTTYENPNVRCVHLGSLLSSDKARTFPLESAPDFCDQK